ncbi:hypothetical protein BU17DRAFT_71574 [Hysterangium stoloniferum]|nr:hypothetical protein BU17DRAFT_71574 [Hysterangium stoloniferum]
MHEGTDGEIERSGRQRNCSTLKRDRKDESKAAYTPIHPGPERAFAPANTNTNSIVHITRYLGKTPKPSHLQSQSHTHNPNHHRVVLLLSTPAQIAAEGHKLLLGNTPRRNGKVKRGNMTKINNHIVINRQVLEQGSSRSESRIKIGRVVGVVVRRWGFDCGADYTGIAIVGIAAATVVGPVPPASPLPPTIPETLCGYAVDIDAPNPKTGANSVRISH